MKGIDINVERLLFHLTLFNALTIAVPITFTSDVTSYYVYYNVLNDDFEVTAIEGTPVITQGVSTTMSQTDSVQIEAKHLVEGSSDSDLDSENSIEDTLQETYGTVYASSATKQVAEQSTKPSNTVVKDVSGVTTSPTTEDFYGTTVKSTDESSISLTPDKAYDYDYDGTQSAEEEQDKLYGNSTFGDINELAAAPTESLNTLSNTEISSIPNPTVESAYRSINPTISETDTELTAEATEETTNGPNNETFDDSIKGSTSTESTIQSSSKIAATTATAKSTLQQAAQKTNVPKSTGDDKSTKQTNIHDTPTKLAGTVTGLVGSAELFLSSVGFTTTTPLLNFTNDKTSNIVHSHTSKMSEKSSAKSTVVSEQTSEIVSRVLPSEASRQTASAFNAVPLSNGGIKIRKQTASDVNAVFMSDGGIRINKNTSTNAATSQQSTTAVTSKFGVDRNVVLAATTGSFKVPSSDDSQVTKSSSFSNSSSSVSHSSAAYKVLTLENYHDYMYLTTIRIGSGKQVAKVQFDTGSSNLWISNSSICSDSTLSSYCEDNGSFDSSKSTTLKDLHKTQNNTYGSGMIAKTEMVKDNIYWGNDDTVLLSNQEFGVANNLTSSIGVMGIMGMSFYEDTNQVPDVFQRAAGIETTGFGLHLGGPGLDGTLILGGVDTAKINGSLVALRTINSKTLSYDGSATSWSVALRNFSSNNNDNYVNDDKIYAALVDTGCTNIGIPSSLFKKVVNDWGLTQGSDGAWNTDCSRIQNFKFGFDNNLIIEVPGKSLITTNSDNSCSLVRLIDQGSESFQLGDYFLRSTYSYWDYESKSLMLGQSKNTTDSKILVVSEPIKASSVISGTG